MDNLIEQELTDAQLETVTGGAEQHFRRRQDDWEEERREREEREERERRWHHRWDWDN